MSLTLDDLRAGRGVVDERGPEPDWPEWSEFQGAREAREAAAVSRRVVVVGLAAGAVFWAVVWGVRAVLRWWL